MSTIQNLNTLISSVGLESQRFEAKPTKTGATRVRASLLQIKKLCDQMRKDVLADSKKIEVKPRSKVQCPPNTPEPAMPDPPTLVRESTSVVGGDVIAAEKKKIKKKLAKKK